MSDCPPGLLSAIGVPLAETVQEYSRRRQLQPPLDPAQKAVRRAVIGAAVLTACLWLSPLLWRNFGGAARGAWAFVAVAGLMALIAGLREARGAVPTNLLAAFWSASLLLAIAGLLLAGMFPADVTQGYIVRGLYVSGLAAAAVSFWVYSGLGQVVARRAIERQLRRQNAPMRPVRRH